MMNVIAVTILSFCQGQYDGKREKERICNCDECNYCRGYNDARHRGTSRM